MTTTELKGHIKGIKETGREIKKSKAKSRKFLFEIGLTTPTGNIKPRFLRKRVETRS